VIGLPAIRRLQQCFPDAKISVLAAKSTASIWTLEPAIQEHITFEFFHTRSGLGPRDLTEDDLMDLRARLARYRFDLAIDLRKSPDTRDILQYTGARYFAGFDTNDRFPWLDVAIQWEGDSRFLPKRQHVANDFINLIDAIANSTNTDRGGEVHQPLPVPDHLPAELFAKRLVCIHPAAGTEMRQWPRSYFAALIDMLAADEDVNLVLVGSPDEDEIASEILELVQNQASVWSLVGKLKLSELPSVIMASSLFVGNNSGPHHLAAALGVPTLGIHSGVVDAHEWGPLGPNAAAIRRDMSCSPCYLAEIGHCTRNLACLKTLRPSDVFAMCRRLLAIGNRETTERAQPEFVALQHNS
jgi:ADP-heptose:LPS heptosyltransferase